jgi:hypothetical protein
MRWRGRVRYEFTALATYNAERSRGIVHTTQWIELMREEKRRFEASLPSQFPYIDYPAQYTSSS